MPGARPFHGPLETKAGGQAWLWIKNKYCSLACQPLVGEGVNNLGLERNLMGIMFEAKL